MPELRQARATPSGHRDHLLGLYQEISRSVDTILHSLPGLPLDMRHRALRIARELLLAQSHVIDRLADLSDVEPSFAGGFGRSEQPEAARPATATHHRPITAWLNQHASDARAELTNNGSGRAPETNVGERPIETFGSSKDLDIASPISPGALSRNIIGGLSGIETDWQSPGGQSNSAKLDRVASELQFTRHVARLPSTIVDHDVASRASSFASHQHANSHGQHATFIAILQSGGGNGGANGSVSERLRQAAQASHAASTYDDDALDEQQHQIEGEIASPRRTLTVAIGRVVARSPLTRPMITKLGVVAMAGASLMFWFGGPPKGGPSGVRAIADTEGARGAPVASAAAIAKVAAATNEASVPTPTDAPQQTGSTARPDKLQSRLSPPMAAPLMATDADPSATSEPRASPSEQAVDAPGPGALVIEPPAIVTPARSSSDPATPAVSEPRPSAADKPVNARAGDSPTAQPPGKVASLVASADAVTPESSEVHTVSRSAQIEKSPPKPMLQKPTHDDAQTRRSNQPSASASKFVVPGAKAPWQTASVAVGGHFAPVLVTLKDKAAALQIFEDLQKRYAATLANKKAALKSFVGPDGQTWYHVAALPAATEAEAKAVCHALGSEGEALDCTVAPY